MVLRHICLSPLTAKCRAAAAAAREPVLRQHFISFVSPIFAGDGSTYRNFKRTHQTWVGGGIRKLILFRLFLNPLCFCYEIAGLTEVNKFLFLYYRLMVLKASQRLKENQV